MVKDTGTDRTIIVALSIFMVMKCTPQNGERKTNNKNDGKFFIHSPT